MNHINVLHVSALIALLLFTTAGCTKKTNNIEQNITQPATTNEPPQPQASDSITPPNEEEKQNSVSNLPESLNVKFENCSSMRKAFENEIAKYNYSQFSTRHELQVTNKELHWNDIESQYPVSLLKVSQDKDALKELEKHTHTQCKLTKSLSAEDNTVVQLYYCGMKNGDDLGYKDTYIGLKSTTDQMTRIYLLPEIDESCIKYLDCNSPELLAVKSRPFLDSTAIYVQLSVSISYSSEFCCFGGTDSNDVAHNTVVFAGPKHRKLGEWTNTYIGETDRSEHDETTETISCEYSYTESTAAFDGKIHITKNVDWTFQNEFKTVINE